MKRKRFIKLSMGVLGLKRNEANVLATMVREEGHYPLRIMRINPNAVWPRGNTKSEVTRWA